MFEHGDVCESRDHNRYIYSSLVLLCELRVAAQCPLATRKLPAVIKKTKKK